MPRARQFLVGAIGILALSALGACGASAAVPVKAAPVPSGAAWRSSAKLGIWKNAGFDVYNNEWNKSAAGPQTIWAYSYEHWGVRSAQPGSTSVKTYPSVQQNFRSPRLSSITQLVSTFTQAMPPVAASYDAEAAYDLWLDNYRVEIMVWVDNHGQTPAGGVVDQAVISGARYDVYQSGSRMISFVISGRPETAGQPADGAAVAGPASLPDPLRRAHPGELRVGDRLHWRCPDGLHADQVHAVHERSLGAVKPRRVKRREQDPQQASQLALPRSAKRGQDGTLSGQQV